MRPRAGWHNWVKWWAPFHQLFIVHFLLIDHQDHQSPHLVSFLKIDLSLDKGFDTKLILENLYWVPLALNNQGFS